MRSPAHFVGTGGSTWSAVYDMSDLSAPDAATNYTEWNNQEWFDLWAQLGEVRRRRREGDHGQDARSHVQ